VPIAKKRVGMSVLGLGTPEVEHWIRAGKGDGERKCTDKGKGKGKSVGFMDENEGEKQDPGPSGSENLDDHERDLMMQISPRRQTASTSWAPAPVSSAGSPAGGAHDFLRTIVQDVMYDFQRETKAEMMGLHLDLVRMGRGWKKELRDLMGEYVGDLKDLREENQRLRGENERLRRGY
jgi:protein NEDD1